LGRAGLAGGADVRGARAAVEVELELPQAASAPLATSTASAAPAFLRLMLG
jgi:hypothetical protein